MAMGYRAPHSLSKTSSPRQSYIYRYAAFTPQFPVDRLHCGHASCESGDLILLQVSKIAESGTDYRKFYISNGAKEMRLRAETR